MKILSWLLVIATMFFAIPSCTKKLRGSGDYTTQSRNLPSFHSIESNGNFDVFIVQSNTPGISITAEDNIINELETIVTEGTLKIRFRRSVNVKHGDITITASMNDIENLSLLGSGFIKPQGTWKINQLNCAITGSGEIAGAFDAGILRLDLGGSGEITISGNVEQSEYRITGSGNIHAYNLNSRDAKVSVTGSGICELSVYRKLEASISGSGKIRYKGNPAELVQHVTGSGRIEKQ